MEKILSFTGEIGFTQMTDARHLSTIEENQYKFLWNSGWKTTAKNLDELHSRATLVFMSEAFHEVVIDGDRYTAMVSLSYGNVTIRLAAKTKEILDRVKAELEAIYPSQEVPKEKTHRIPVQFWTMGDHGPTAYNRSIEVPSWEEIADNYATSDRRAIERLVQHPFSDEPAGARLILWHGEPGTGKTYALRSLAYEWQLWCDTHYIVDPERFFGSDSNYMLKLILQNVNDDEDELTYFDSKGTLRKEDKKPPRWKLLIFEDTGELMSRDAASRSGQGLSRLLNVVDGLIGQGLRIIVLITTNEELKALHPAIARPGRCSNLIQFHKLDTIESQEWLAKNKVLDANINGGYTIAELFALKDESFAFLRQEPSKATIGFG